MADRIGTAVAGASGAARDADLAPSSPALGRILALAAALAAAPAALLVMRRGDRAAVAAFHGFEARPRDVAWAFPLSETVSIGDLLADPRAPVQPFDGEPARFYAGAPVPGPGGEVLGTLCVFGRTPRPALSAADLGRLAALAGIAGDALDAVRARQRAEAVAEAKAGLLAEVSHELRTSLSGIVGLVEVLKRGGPLADDASRTVERIDGASHGMLSIVGDALDLARFESGLVKLDPRPFPPARLIEDAAAMVRPDAERKGLGLVLDLPPVPPGCVLGDPDRLRQVILNLLSNAVKFTDQGTVRLSLSVGRADARGLPLTVAVKDSGIGLTGEDVSRLFRRLSPADGGVAGRRGGNGLGLAISRTLVEAMGGEIAVDSAPGAGSRFAVSLRLPQAEAPLSAPRRDGTPGRGMLRGHAILVAEDTAVNQKLVTEMLEPLGAEVDVVADGAASVEAASRRGYAVVLMDMEMPVLGGLDATKRIRALGGAAGAVPIVALTANAFPEQLDLCRAAGMDDHLIKPFGADELAAIVLRWARRLVPAEGGAA